MPDKQREKPLEHVRELYADKGLDALWAWAMSPDGAHAKAKRFRVLEIFAQIERDHAKDEADRELWGKRRQVYARQRDKYERRYENQHDDAEWPEDIDFSELLYHDPPHLHIASPQRDRLTQLCKVGQEKFGLRIGEFPPFDPVECVHVDPGSWHYRDSSNPWTSRSCANRGDGCAADCNDLDGGNDQEYAFYIEIRRRYA